MTHVDCVHLNICTSVVMIVASYAHASCVDFIRRYPLSGCIAKLSVTSRS